MDEDFQYRQAQRDIAVMRFLKDGAKTRKQIAQGVGIAGGSLQRTLEGLQEAGVVTMRHIRGCWYGYELQPPDAHA